MPDPSSSAAAGRRREGPPPSAMTLALMPLPDPHRLQPASSILQGSEASSVTSPRSCCPRSLPCQPNMSPGLHRNRSCPAAHPRLRVVARPAHRRRRRSALRPTYRCPTVDDVFALLPCPVANQRVVVRPAVDDVVAKSPHDVVFAAKAAYLVIAFLAGHQIWFVGA